jgi:hypothetical protein
MGSRLRIPQDISDRLMYLNRHTCCICHTSRKHVQIHHIDGNNSNNVPYNLAVLCLDCHSLVTGDGGLGRSYTPGEVSLYKSEWEQYCAPLNYEDEHGDGSSEDDVDSEDEDEVEEEGEDIPADHHYEDSVLPADSHLPRHYKLDGGDEIRIWTESDEPVDVMIMRTSQYNRWSEDKDNDSVKFLEYHENQYELNTSCTVSSSGNYTVVVCNHADEDVSLRADFSIWE